jgi:hypothetical protein
VNPLLPLPLALLPRRLLGRLLVRLLAVLLRGVPAWLPLVLERLTRALRNLLRLLPVTMLTLLLSKASEGLPKALSPAAAAAAAAARLLCAKVGVPLSEPSESVPLALLPRRPRE